LDGATGRTRSGDITSIDARLSVIRLSETGSVGISLTFYSNLRIYLCRNAPVLSLLFPGRERPVKQSLALVFIAFGAALLGQALLLAADEEPLAVVVVVVIFTGGLVLWSTACRCCCTQSFSHGEKQKKEKTSKC
jgi:hypothetical protein